MRILPLSSVPHHASQITDWLWQAFGSENSRDFYASVVQSSLSGADLPQTFIALDGERLAGTVGLWRCDLISRQDLTPWLAALYVDKDYRSRGLGQQLQDRITAAKRASCEAVLESLKSGDRDIYIDLMEQIAENAQSLRRDAKIR